MEIYEDYVQDTYTDLSQFEYYYNIAGGYLSGWGVEVNAVKISGLNLDDYGSHIDSYKLFDFESLELSQ